MDLEEEDMAVRNSFAAEGRAKQNSNTLRWSLLIFCLVSIAGGLLVYGMNWTGSYGWFSLWGGFLLICALLLRRYTLIVTAIVAIHLYVDYYLGLHLIAPLLAIGLLILLYLQRAQSIGWTRPAGLWLWLVFLFITIYPCWQGGQLMLYDAASFYPSDILGAFLLYWLGNICSHGFTPLRTLFVALTVLAILLAIHTFVQATTGIVLLNSSRVDTFLSSVDVAYYQMMNTDTHRIGSLFIDPNWNGAYFSMMFFLPAGLFITCSSLLQKVSCLCAMLMILIALILTYSTGAWVAFFVGLLVFWLYLDDVRYRIALLCCLLGVVTILTTLTPAQLQLQLQHATADNELSLRIAAWHTAWNVIQAYPWTGVGLGHQAYLLRAEAFRVPEQFVQLSHPHDSYLEWAAMAGIPVLFIFLLLLSMCHLRAFRNWQAADRSLRPLLMGGIAATLTLSVNSISINGWTHFALTLFGWLILGATSSPHLIAQKERP
jgi:O-antigen ligase